MRLARISISIIGLALGSLVLSTTGASAASPCAPGQPFGRPPGQPALSPGPFSARPPQYPPGKCQLLLSAAAGRPDTSVTAAGDGFKSGSSISMTLGRTSVASAAADSSGRFTQSFTVPSGIVPGQYDVRATGVGTDGTPYEQGATFEVLPAAAATTPAAAGSVLRPGAGLAAAPRSGSTGLIAVPVPGGGLTVVPGGSTSGSPLGGGAIVGGTVENAPLGSAPAASGQIVGGTTVGGPGSTGGPNPFLLVGAGLALVGAGAGTAMVAKRRKGAKS